MCGFVGQFSARDAVYPEDIARALETLTHRGPDAKDVWISEDRAFGLGHVRLSIIGLNNGEQPIPNEIGDRRVVVNGELYGYRAIREALIAQGCHFSTESDSEIAIHLYERYGMDFVHQLRGEYAIAIADERRRQLVAVRDRFGIKPLFWTRHRGAVVVASEIKALAALGVPIRWNEEAVYAELYSVRASHNSLFKGIFSVPPGHFLIATEDNVQIQPYWDTCYPTQEALGADTRSETEVVEEFRAVLDEAVRERLVADVEVASYLSGGIDSCAVLGLAQRHHSRPIRAFTLTFDHELYDEEKLAEEMAAFAGASFHPVAVTQQGLADAFEDAVWHAETLMFNSHGVAKYLLSRAVRDAGVKVVFTGEGSDEILAGYPPSRRDMVLFNREGQAPGSVERLLESMSGSNEATRSVLMAEQTPSPVNARIEQRLGWVPSWMGSFGALGDAAAALTREPDAAPARAVAACDEALDALPVDARIKRRDPVNQGLYLWSKHLLHNYVLTVLSDRMEMAHSIEGRVPFLDHHVAEAAARAPVAMKVRGPREKYLLREAVSGVITETVRNREKHPFASPPAQSNDPMDRFVEEVLASEYLNDQPFFDPAKVRAFAKARGSLAVDARFGADFTLLRVVSTCLLHKRFAIA